MTKKLNIAKVIGVALCATFSTIAMADQAGDNLIGVGVSYISPETDSGNLKLGTVSLPNTGSKVNPSTTFIVTGTHYFTDNISVDVVGGIPPKFKIDAKGMSGFGVNKIGTARQWQPAIIAKYVFGKKEQKLRPFVGIGATYVWYTNVQVDPALKNLLIAASGNASSTVKAKSTSDFKPVITAGANYSLTEKLGLTVAIAYTPIKTTTTATVTTPSGVSTNSQTTAKLSTIVGNVILSYKF